MSKDYLCPTCFGTGRSLHGMGDKSCTTCWGSGKIRDTSARKPKSTLPDNEEHLKVDPAVAEPLESEYLIKAEVALDEVDVALSQGRVGIPHLLEFCRAMLDWAKSVERGSSR